MLSDNQLNVELESLKARYTEINNLFRFYLTWRQLLFGGYFAVIAAFCLAFRWAAVNNFKYIWFIPLIGAIISYLFWALDWRNRQLYELVCREGNELENRMGRLVYENVDENAGNKKELEQKISQASSGYFSGYEKGEIEYLERTVKPGKTKPVFFRRLGHQLTRHKFTLSVLYLGGVAGMLALTVLSCVYDIHIKDKPEDPEKIVNQDMDFKKNTIKQSIIKNQ